jgi:hypothetical protein
MHGDPRMTFKLPVVHFDTSRPAAQSLLSADIAAGGRMLPGLKAPAPWEGISEGKIGGKK